MAIARRIVEEISKYLVDQEPDFEFEHWSEAEILTYLRDAINIVSMNLKSMFTNTVPMRLSPGSLQRLPAGCSQLVSVLGMKNRDGSIRLTARRTSTRNVGLLKREPCSTGGNDPANYRVDEYQIDTSDLRSFIVSPPVPEGSSAEVYISCFGPPTLNSLDDELAIPDHLIPIIKEFMLYYAYGVDTESVTTRDYADRHWKNGVTLLAAEKAYNPINKPDMIVAEKAT